MKFIRLISHGPCNAFYNMALDEAISDAVRKKLSPPTLRFYSWDVPSISIGYFQSISDIDSEYCASQSFPVVRRQTGGRAILHDAELTYSFNASSDTPPFNGSLLDNYALISQAMISGLRLCGVEAKSSSGKKQTDSHKNPACFKAVSYGEVTVDGRKIIGSAQKRFSDGFLQHGSVLFNFSSSALCKVLGQTDEIKFLDIGALNEYSSDLTEASLKSALKQSFENTLNAKLINDDPTKFELKLASELEQKKYSSPEWNNRR